MAAVPEVRRPPRRHHAPSSCAYDTEGVTVEHRNAVHGPARASRTRSRCSRTSSCPTENLIGKEGQGLKIALTTLNTGRLALPAICVGAGQVGDRRSRASGRPSASSGASRSASTTPSRRRSRSSPRTRVRPRGDARRRQPRWPTTSSNDIRIEAAIAKLYGSELGWKVVDELIQIRGGRGYETAESLKARGEKPVPGRAGAARHADQPHLRGLDRDHAPADRARGRRPAPARSPATCSRPTARSATRPRSAVEARRSSTPSGCRSWPSARARSPRSYDEFGAAGRAPALRRARLAQARPLDLLRDEPLAGQARAAGRRSSGRIVDIGAELFAISAAVVYADTIAARAARARATRRCELADLFCPQARRRVDALFHELWANDDDANYAAAQKRARRPLHVARGGHQRPRRSLRINARPLVPRIRSSTLIRSSLTCERPVVPGP